MAGGWSLVTVLIIAHPTGPTAFHPPDLDRSPTTNDDYLCMANKGSIAKHAAAASSSSTKFSRRGVLVGAAGAGALAAVGTVGLGGAAATPRPSLPKRTPIPSGSGTGVPAPRDWATRLLSRAAYGPTPASVAEANALGSPSAWVAKQLNSTAIPDPVGDTVRGLYPELNWSITQVHANIKEFSWDVQELIGPASLAQAIWSSRQLYEVMVEFWSNHLNVTCPSDSVWDNRQEYDRLVIRPNALGKFKTMLAASAKSASMLRYLNNDSSTKDSPNENYGRELLELHTVGVDGGYTETMVQHSARIFTGWTVHDNTGLAYYNPTIHDTQPASVLGFSNANSAADGRPVVDAYLAYLAGHRKTAERIASKLVKRFVSDADQPALEAHLADVFQANDTDIKPVLVALFASHEFWGSRGAKVKRPYEDLVSTARVVGMAPLATGTNAVRRDAFSDMYWQARDLRNAPLYWGPPNGYPDFALAWQSADGALGRWNLHQAYAAGWWPNSGKIQIANLPSMLPSPLPATYGQLVDALSMRLIFTTLTGPQRDAVLVFMAKTATSPLKSTDSWVTYKLSQVVSLLLDSPTHTLR